MSAKTTWDWASTAIKLVVNAGLCPLLLSSGGKVDEERKDPVRAVRGNQEGAGRGQALRYGRIPSEPHQTQLIHDHLKQNVVGEKKG